MRQARMFRAPRHTIDQPELLPPTLEDLVPPGHLVRRLKEIVDSLDLTGVEGLYDDKGGYPYAPSSMLGILLFGLMDGERSSRRIQEHCRFDARYRFLCGAQVPDDRTICRFRRRLESVLPDLFNQILQIARSQGLVKLQVVAIDGTKVEGNVTQWRKVLTQAEAEDSADPDCRRMSSPKGKLNGYNAQAVVDTSHGIVLATDVGNVASDYKELPHVVEKAIGNMGDSPQALVADKGYDSSENADFLEQKGITPYLHPKNQGADFWSFDEAGQIVCPEGHTLAHQDRYKRGGVETIRQSIKQCPACPLKSTCHTSYSKQLTFPKGIDPAARIRNALRCKTPEGAAVLACRGPSVETLFGHLKWNRGFRRFRHRGLPAVRAEFMMECLARNLEKVARAFSWLNQWLTSNIRPSYHRAKVPWAWRRLAFRSKQGT